MTVQSLNHFTIRCTPAQLPALVAFYTDVIGLHEGARPAIRAPGKWMYANGEPIVHLLANVGDAQAAWPQGTGAFDHVSFACRGLDRTRTRLRSLGVDFREAPLADWPIQQLFLRDPAGVQVELTFWLQDEARQAG